MRVGFLGVGSMGSAMAVRALEDGLDVVSLAPVPGDTNGVTPPSVSCQNVDSCAAAWLKHPTARQQVTIALFNQTRNALLIFLRTPNKTKKLIFGSSRNLCNLDSGKVVLSVLGHGGRDDGQTIIARRIVGTD